MGGSSSAETDRIGPVIGRGEPTWTILLVSISRWTRPTSALSTAMALLSARAGRRRRRRRSRTSWRRRQAVVASSGRTEEAKAVAGRLLALQPNFAIGSFLAHVLSIMREELIQALGSGLR